VTAVTEAFCRIDDSQFHKKSGHNDVHQEQTQHSAGKTFTMTKIGTLTVTVGIAVASLTISGLAQAAPSKSPPASSYMIERPDPALKDRQTDPSKPKGVQPKRQTAQSR